MNVGGHLIEDPGSGLTKVFEHAGKELAHGTVSAEMPVWDNEKQAWGSVRDRYTGSKSELKKVIKALIETPYSELDRWDGMWAGLSDAITAHGGDCGSAPRWSAS